eukprot:9756278-Alexandrium_andersonii.AAC.1
MCIRDRPSRRDIKQPACYAELERAHVIAAGLPCQSTSRAGVQRGREDPRDARNDFARIVEAVRPP